MKVKWIVLLTVINVACACATLVDRMPAKAEAVDVSWKALYLYDLMIKKKMQQLAAPRMAPKTRPQTI